MNTLRGGGAGPTPSDIQMKDAESELLVSILLFLGSSGH